MKTNLRDRFVCIENGQIALFYGEAINLVDYYREFYSQAR
jgi:hypothetical protein